VPTPNTFPFPITVKNVAVFAVIFAAIEDGEAFRVPQTLSVTEALPVVMAHDRFKSIVILSFLTAIIQRVLSGLASGKSESPSGGLPCLPRAAFYPAQPRGGSVVFPASQSLSLPLLARFVLKKGPPLLLLIFDTCVMVTGGPPLVLRLRGPPLALFFSVGIPCSFLIARRVISSIALWD